VCLGSGSDGSYIWFVGLGDYWMGAVVLMTWGVILGVSCRRIIIVGGLVQSQDRRSIGIF